MQSAAEKTHVRLVQAMLPRTFTVMRGRQAVATIDEVMPGMRAAKIGDFRRYCRAHGKVEAYPQVIGDGQAIDVIVRMHGSAFVFRFTPTETKPHGTT